jgi:ABC-type nitrate/sulfonate/bicarbonate transport system substrate-binding protein
LGWYSGQNLDVQFVPLAWGDVVLSLAGGTVDACVYTINAFEPPYESAALGSSKPVFYAPIYVFNGTAIMVHGNAGLKPLGDLAAMPAGVREAAIRETAAQLRGKRIAVTKGTEYEQIVLAALQRARLNPDTDVRIIHSSPDDALTAFLSGDIDAFGAGLTERVEARRHGGVELMVASDVGQPSINGIVTTEKFANEHRDALDEIVRLWFRTIRFMETDLKSNSRYVLDYLAGKASTRYTPDQYVVAWSFDVFPKDEAAAWDLFEKESSPYYWRSSWQQTNDFLIAEKRIRNAVPISAYWGTSVLSRLKSQTK